MSEFATSAAVDVQVSPSSLRDARSTIESELGDVKVDVTTSSSGGSGGSRMAGRERAMGRQLQSKTNEHLSGIDTHWTENIDLNRERNDLLRQLVDVTEKDAQTRGRGGGVGGGALGLAIGGIGLGSMLLSGLGSTISNSLGDAVGKLDPRDWNIPSPVPDDWKMPSPVPTDWQIPSPVPDDWQLPSPVPDDWNMPSPVPNDWQMPSPVPDDWGIPSPVPDDWQMPSPVPDDWGLPTVEIKKPDWIPIPIGSPGGTDSPTGDGTGSPVPDWVPSKEDVGTGVAAGAGAAAGAAARAGPWLKSSGSSIASKSASVATPAMDGAMLPDEMFPDGENPWKGQSGLERARGAYGVFPGGNTLNNPPESTPADDPDQWKTSPTTTPTNPGPVDLSDTAAAANQGAPPLANQQSGGNQSDSSGQSMQAQAEQTNHFEINVPIDDLEREASQKFGEVDRRLSKLERALGN